MLSYTPGISRLPCLGDTPLPPPTGPRCQEKQSQWDPLQSLLSGHFLLAARAQIGNQDLIHLIRAVSIPDPAWLPTASHPPPNHKLLNMHHID